MRRTPQEKKRLSYEKDRRNNYGESPHGSRKCIPRNKARRNRANRHLQEQPLRQLCGRPDEYTMDEAESRMWHSWPHEWKKVPDAPLREVVRWDTTMRRSMQEAGGRRALYARFRYADGKFVPVDE